MPHDRGSGPYEAGQPVTYESRHQTVLNTSWPERDKDGWHARTVREQPADKHVAVRVRCVFESDGECWIDGTATRWAASHVLVEVDDVRVMGRKVWVAAGDVVRG
jgi:hypothetical protein